MIIFVRVAPHESDGRFNQTTESLLRGVHEQTDGQSGRTKTGYPEEDGSTQPQDPTERVTRGRFHSPQY